MINLGVTVANSELEEFNMNNKFNRRSLIKAAAWATPVVAFAAAAPLASASPESATLGALQISQARTGVYGGTGTWATATGPLIGRCTDTTPPTLTITDNSGNLGWSTGVLTAGYSAGNRFTSLRFYTSTGTLLALDDTITTSSGTFTVTDITATSFEMSCPGLTITTATTTIEFPKLASEVVTQTTAGTNAQRTITYATFVTALGTGGTSGVIFAAR